jgi:hypothetical protein
MSEEDEFLEHMRRDLEKQYRFYYSEIGKPDRERWVVSVFLTQRKILFADAELITPKKDDPVDVGFRAARFQVKEVTSPRERRQDEIKSTYRRVSMARTLKDTIGPGFVYDNSSDFL